MELGHRATGRLRTGKEIDKCHRSKLAWSRQATLPGYSSSIGAMADSLDPQMDYHFIACSGARTYDMLTNGQSHEVAQIDAGYLDQNTSRVCPVNGPGSHSVVTER
ncbi:hypothetical protein AB0451_33450 [Streptomyces sp. NPDC052000]|uniref:hypothetical protein n=1 Tax=Streptomyces sp. NPDC052000 TaxID=3155676 RepID=UPI00344C2B29